MYKTGLKGSVNDAYSGNKSTKLYNSLTAQKGKKYADAVESRVKQKAVRALVADTALLAVGLSMIKKYS